MTDYAAIGLKVGLEIHQQLATAEKLFCSCRSAFSSAQPAATLTRQLRAVAGELGATDIAASQETLKQRQFRYAVYPAESCLVEMDEEPPHRLNPDALDTALTAALLLQCDLPDEIQVMRKQVIDGSTTSGFQRTAIAGLNGRLTTVAGPVRISTVAVEEDSAQILSQEGSTVIYGLDRLGIPLIEIGTEPDITSPAQAREAALALGTLLRSTERVKRGLGTIRQDINISIAGGARIEIKGAQDLDLIPLYVENEVRRQQALLALRDDLKRQGFRPITPRIHEVTPIFQHAASPLTRQRATHAFVVPGCAGLLSRPLAPGLTVGNELAQHVRGRTGLAGFIHSDEDLGKYQLQNEFAQLRAHLKARPDDLVVVAAGDEAVHGLHTLADRMNRLLDGVPEETRKALPDGKTAYLRPLPGASRLYPETDIPPIPVSSERIRSLKRHLPEPWNAKISRFIRQYRLNREIAMQVVRSDSSQLFEALAKEHDPPLVASVLTAGVRELERREGVDTSRLTDAHFRSAFAALKDKQIAKEAILPVLKLLAEKPDQRIGEAISALGLTAMPAAQLRQLIQGIIRSHPDILGKDRPEQIYMGLVMKEVRGKVDGGTVMTILREELRKQRH